MLLPSIKDSITILDDFFAECGPSLDGEPEAYESLKAAVLAQQANNKQSAPCPVCGCGKLVPVPICDDCIRSSVIG